MSTVYRVDYAWGVVMAGLGFTYSRTVAVSVWRSVPTKQIQVVHGPVADSALLKSKATESILFRFHSKMRPNPALQRTAAGVAVAIGASSTFAPSCGAPSPVRRR